VRQKDNLFTKQVVCGNTWEGPAFVSTPPVLEFIDFEVGETYVKTFTLTNISNTFNMFRPQVRLACMCICICICICIYIELSI